MTYETIKSETIFRGNVFDLRRDQVRLPDGSLATLEIVDHPGAVTVLPLDSQGQIWFVRQYRHGIRGELLELPAGTLEADEDPETCALREAREEIGMGARQLKKLGEFFLAPGYSSEFLHAYLATDLYPDPLQGDQDEFLAVEQYPIRQVFAMVEKGAIRDGKTLATLFLAHPLLKDWL